MTLDELKQLAESFESGVSSPIADGFSHNMRIKNYTEAKSYLREELNKSSDETLDELIEYYKPQFKRSNIVFNKIDKENIKEDVQYLARCGDLIFVVSAIPLHGRKGFYFFHGNNYISASKLDEIFEIN